MQAVLEIIKKEFTIEWRQRYAINGIILQVISSAMVAYLGVKVVNAPTWNAIFWLVLLFSAISAIAKSFIAESAGKQLFYYGILSAQQLITAKLIYNACITIVLSLLCLLAFSIFLGFPVQHPKLFILITLLGAIGFSSTFTLLSAIASKSGNGNLLMPVLSLPLIIPLMLVAIKAAKKAVDGLDFFLFTNDLLMLSALNILVVMLALVLFPFLWKD